MGNSRFICLICLNVCLESEYCLPIATFLPSTNFPNKHEFPPRFSTVELLFYMDLLPITDFIAGAYFQEKGAARQAL